MYHSEFNTGFKPKFKSFQNVLVTQLLLVRPELLGTKIVIHHITEREDSLQLEVEFRHPKDGIKFERVFLKDVEKSQELQKSSGEALLRFSSGNSVAVDLVTSLRWDELAALAHCAAHLYPEHRSLYDKIKRQQKG